jgi:tetratricopeptide (TPR) repeat protein
MIPPPIELPSRYQITALLGEGGAGKVFRVHDRTRGREVALKVVGPSEASWLRNEFHTLRSIRHENLIHAFESSTLPMGGAYYTMELIDGVDLGRQVHRPNSEDWLRPVLVGVLRGLGHLHCHGGTHGDLKPGNVLLGRGGVVKVTDIGMGTSLRCTATSSGTPGYTAPEVWISGSLTSRSDLYSVGVVAYEALTGKHPFAARTIRDVIAGQVEGWVPSLSAHGVRITQALERAVMRALERDPQLRYGSADEFLDAIGEDGSVGEILGGRFVARQAERSRLLEFVQSKERATPNLLYLSGPVGIGKSALLEEALASCDDSTLGLVREIREPERDLTELAGLSSGVANEPAKDSIRVSTLADALSSRFPGTRRLISIEDPPPQGDLIRRIARYVWAEATERGTATSLRFIKVVQAPPSALEPFEVCLDLGPFSDAAVSEMIVSLLGQFEPDPAFLRRLVEEVGGNPASLSAAIIELVDRKLIIRRFGRWRIHEVSDDDWAALRTTTSRWHRDWSRLDNGIRDALAAICLVNSGLQVDDLKILMPPDRAEAVASRLQAAGWVELHGDTLRPSSREITRVVLSLASSAAVDRVRSLILSTLAERLPRSDRASLLLGAGPSPEAVAEGLWYGEECRATGSFAEALRVLTTVRAMASDVRDSRSMCAAALSAAGILYQSGSAEEALALLGIDGEWPAVDDCSDAVARRAMLQGLSFKSLRKLEDARSRFELCASEALRLGDARLRLQAESELAEIEWRYGGEAGRGSAQQRVESVLASQEVSSELHDELASLQYQLGAALVMAGKREAAVSILESALQRANSNYWKMRICNALGSAHYYLGSFRSALAASERAWRHAVDGEVDSFKPRILSNAAGVRFGLGMFREAAEQDELAAFWGRRIGSPFEYEAGLLAAAYDFIHIAEFERALKAISEAGHVAASETVSRHAAKALEMEALALIHLGDYESAQDRIAQAEAMLTGFGFDDTAPRLRWHAGRIEMERGNYTAAEARFSEALTDLEETHDWEDLPGVQVEMQLLLARSGDQRLDVEKLRGLLEDARGRSLCPVQLRATLALAEISGLHSQLLGNVLPVLEDGLRLAESSGAREFVWRLSYWIARVLANSGDNRSGVARMGMGVRVLREVASGLTPAHRSSYLATSHARLLLSGF